MKRSDLLIVVMASLALSANAVAEPIPVIGQLGGYGPVVSSELVGTDFAN